MGFHDFPDFPVYYKGGRSIPHHLSTQFWALDDRKSERVPWKPNIWLLNRHVYESMIAVSAIDFPCPRKPPRENLNRKSWCFYHEISGFPVKFPYKPSQSMDSVPFLRLESWWPAPTSVPPPFLWPCIWRPWLVCWRLRRRRRTCDC